MVKIVKIPKFLDSLSASNVFEIMYLIFIYFNQGTLTDVFLDRVFQECVTYGGEMDYKSYLDFIIALENRSEPQALQYIFRILDIKQKGHLNAFDLNFFFRAIQKQLKKYGHEPVPFKDVQDEIFDMIKPTDPYAITLVDLINSGHGETVTNILIDLNSFWTHENRESLVAEPSSSTPAQESTEPTPAAPVIPGDDDEETNVKSKEDSKEGGDVKEPEEAVETSN